MNKETTIPTTQFINSSRVWTLLGVLLLVGMPLLTRLSPLLSLLSLPLFVWSGISLWRRGHLPQPSFMKRTLLVLVALTALSFSFTSFRSLELAVALLLSMLFLKMLELRALRDLWFLLSLLFFLSMSHLLFNQTMANTLYVLGCLLTLLTWMVHLAQPQATMRDLGPCFRLAFTLTLQAIPVMILLFLFFPRLPGPLFVLSQEMMGHSARTGLSGSMTPGAIRSLIVSDQLAFRVEFLDPPPEPNARYWRGPVLWRFFNNTWHTAELPTAKQDLDTQSHSSPPLRYWVTLEPHDRYWLFALDLPGTPPQTIKRLADYQWHNKRPVRQRYRYPAISHIYDRADRTLDLEQYILGLTLPDHGNEQARQLARHWVEQSHHTPRQVVQAALEYFHQEAFYYTLDPPPLLGRNSIDDFLFNTRRGFCEHYAGAFTFLMRSAGIPARVVTGYLGGEIHPMDGHMTLRQSDAHAWSEVWLDGEGWLRVDPTAAIDPQRVEVTVSRALSLLHPSTRIITSWPWFLDPWQVWDMLDNNWNLWVLGYGQKQQMDLLQHFGGEGSWHELIMVLATLLTLALMALFFYLMWHSRAWRWQRPGAVRYYALFCQRMTRLGSPRLPHEGPLDYATRLVARHPERTDWVWQVTHCYISLRYDHQETREGLVRLRKLVRQSSTSQKRSSSLSFPPKIIQHRMDGDESAQDPRATDHR
ncbi:MAG: DUF3488 and transglutaminase-like domain-containing protein [Magnetococcus sp. YQC-5]